jgi:hypothetical protein
VMSSGGSVSASQLAEELHGRKAAEKIREAATLLGEASAHLGKIKPPVQRWYDCNKLYHGAIDWLDQWEPGR